jgi:hypothetical protein
VKCFSVFFFPPPPPHPTQIWGLENSKNTNFLPQFEKKEAIWWNFAKEKKTQPFVMM